MKRALSILSSHLHLHRHLHHHLYEKNKKLKILILIEIYSSLTRYDKGSGIAKKLWIDVSI